MSLPKLTRTLPLPLPLPLLPLPLLPLVAISTMALLGACGKSDESSKKSPEPAPQAPAAASAIDAAPAPVPGDPVLKSHMQEHFDSILVIQRAVVVGDLKTVKERAELLAKHEPASELANFASELEEVRVAASALTKVDTLAAAAEGGAQLASRCGRCHLETSSITSFEWSEAPKADGTTKSAMQRHQWAMDRLWEGLVGPSNMSWQRGAELLLEKPLASSVPEMKGQSAKISELLAKEEKLAKEARAASSLGQRAKLYGELLGVCASCHAERDAHKKD